MPDSNAIAPIFKYNDRSHVRLTPFQAGVRKNVLANLCSGGYDWEDVPCLCGSDNEQCISGTDRYGLPIVTVICRDCGLLRTNPRLKAESLKHFYANYYRDLYMGPEHGTMEQYFETMVRSGEAILKTFSEALPDYDLRNKSVLEIGCSAGGNLFPFLKKGAKVKGYDYDPRYIAFGNSLENKLNLNVGGLENLHTEGVKYDVIIVNHVLEHLYDPIQAIELLRDALVDGGMLYIGVPGLRNSIYYFSPTKSFLGSLHIGHVYHFTRNSLCNVARGFEIVHCDDEIRVVLRKTTTVVDNPRPTDYGENISFIREYEYSWAWKKYRLKKVIIEFPALVSLIFPPLLSNIFSKVYFSLRRKS